MAKCPECRAEIDTLQAEENATKTYDFCVTDDGKVHYDNPDTVAHDTEPEFFCLECGHLIATCEKEAIAFLKGK